MTTNLENPPPGEQLHIDNLIKLLGSKMEHDYAGSRTFRDAHPKMHGCVKATVTIDDDLPDELAHGIFSKPGSYPTWVRFSNQSGTISADKKRDIRGVGIKMMGVDGDKLLPNEESSPNHDFIMISDSRFVTKDVEEFDGLVEGLVGGPKKMLVYFLTHLRVVRNLFMSLRKHANPLDIRYFSVAPYLLRDKAVKYSLTPRHASKSKIPSNPSYNFLREAMVRQLTDDDALFDISVQVQVDPVKQPVEDPGIRWSEKVSPFRKVGTLKIASQVFDTRERDEFGDNLSFSPWRCLEENRPLGGISRARKEVYRVLSVLRHELNRAPRVEPSVDDEEWHKGT